MKVPRLGQALLVSMILASLMVSGCQQEADRTSYDQSRILDHIIYSVPNLNEGSLDLTAQLGIEPTPGGKHTHIATENRLFSLGNRQYFEILGPQVGIERLDPFTSSIAAQEGPDLLTFCLEVDDLEAIAKLGDQLGLEVSEITEGSRMTPSGEVLNYRALHLYSPEFKGLIPFFIDWQGSFHPAEMAATGAKLVSFSVSHKNAQRLAEIYKALEVGVTIQEAETPSIRVEISSDSGLLVLEGSGKGLL